MSKSKDPIYVAERLRRMTIRKAKRRVEQKEKHRVYGRGSATCSMCGGAQSWCSSCEVWSSTCCCDWGTCQCS